MCCELQILLSGNLSIRSSWKVSASPKYIYILENEKPGYMGSEESKYMKNKTPEYLGNEKTGYIGSKMLGYVGNEKPGHMGKEELG